jgi:hypothetical protein
MNALNPDDNPYAAPQTASLPRVPIFARLSLLNGWASGFCTLGALDNALLGDRWAAVVFALFAIANLTLAITGLARR